MKLARNYQRAGNLAPEASLRAVLAAIDTREREERGEPAALAETRYTLTLEWPDGAQVHVPVAHRQGAEILLQGIGRAVASLAETAVPA